MAALAATALADTSFRDIPSVSCTSCGATQLKWLQWLTVGAGLGTGGRDYDAPSNFRMQRSAPAPPLIRDVRRTATKHLGDDHE
jgi:hypothetical protein